jgi:hypothetical protein
MQSAGAKAAPLNAPRSQRDCCETTSLRRSTVARVCSFSRGKFLSCPLQKHAKFEASHASDEIVCRSRYISSGKQGKSAAAGARSARTQWISRHSRSWNARESDQRPNSDTRIVRAPVGSLADYYLAGQFETANLLPGDYTMQLVASDRLASSKRQIAVQRTHFTVSASQRVNDRPVDIWEPTARPL